MRRSESTEGDDPRDPPTWEEAVRRLPPVFEIGILMPLGILGALEYSKGRGLPNEDLFEFLDYLVQENYR